MINWDEIKQEYETTKITLAKLAEKYDIPLGTIKSQKSRDTKNGATKSVYIVGVDCI